MVPRSNVFQIWEPDLICRILCLGAFGEVYRDPNRSVCEAQAEGNMPGWYACQMLPDPCLVFGEVRRAPSMPWYAASTKLVETISKFCGWHTVTIVKVAESWSLLDGLQMQANCRISWMESIVTVVTTARKLLNTLCNWHEMNIAWKPSPVWSSLEMHLPIWEERPSSYRPPRSSSVAWVLTRSFCLPDHGHPSGSLLR